MKAFRPLLSFVFLVALWQAIGTIRVFNPIYFATPREVFDVLTNGKELLTLLLDTGGTLLRVLVSLALASLLGWTAGIAMGTAKFLHESMRHPYDFFRSIPPVVVYPLFLIAYGTGDAARVVTAALGSSVVSTFLIAQGLSQESTVLRSFFRSQGARPAHILRDVISFQALPHFLTATKTSASLTLIVIVVTEMLVGTSHGLGNTIQNVQITGNVPMAYTAIIMTGMLGLTLNATIDMLLNRTIYWKTDSS